MTEPSRTMSGKTCLVTGATAGIGRVTAIELGRLGATVVVAGRDRGRCEATAREVREAGGSAEVLVADLSVQSEVRRLAAEVLAGHDRLDVLVNNAGAMFAERRETAEGIEMTLALNHLAPFLLTDLLLPALKAAAPSRVVTVSSEAHRMGGGLDLDDLQLRKGYGGLSAYSRSKFANILFSDELSRRLAGTGVTSNALHPGFVASNFSNGNGLLGWTFRRLASLMAITTEEGAKTSLYLATSPAVAGITGRYFAKSKEATPSKASQDPTLAARLWSASEALTTPAATLA